MTSEFDPHSLSPQCPAILLKNMWKSLLSEGSAIIEPPHEEESLSSYPASDRAGSKFSWPQLGPVHSGTHSQTELFLHNPFREQSSSLVHEPAGVGGGLGGRGVGGGVGGLGVGGGFGVGGGVGSCGVGGGVGAPGGRQTTDPPWAAAEAYFFSQQDGPVKTEAAQPCVAWHKSQHSAAVRLLFLMTFSVPPLMVLSFW